MILDATATTLPNNETIAALAASEFEFYLTGSRYFGCARPDSDWDFIVKETPAVQKFLDQRGFSENLFEYYATANTDTVTAGVVQAGDVQVALVDDAHLKRKARDGIKQFNYEYHQFAGTAERTRLWNDWLSILRRVSYEVSAF